MIKTKITLISFLVLLALFISGCTGGVRPVQETNYNVGREGLVMEITNEVALREVFEDTNLALSLLIDNRGAHNVIGDQQAILTLGYDPFFIELSGTPPGEVTVGDSSVVIRDLALLGKSRFYPNGQETIFYFPYLKTKPVEGQRESPETQIFASICYPYSTTLSTLACVDFDVYQENIRTQVCRQSDLGFSDQGAPVAITTVEVENFPSANVVKPVFTIHIDNIGRGTVLGPIDNALEFDRVCGAEDVALSDFNSLQIEAWISNDVKLLCSPENVKLTYGRGLARCEVGEEDLEKISPYNQNYLAALTINLSYIYLSTIETEIEIQRLDPYGHLLIPDDGQECLPHQVTIGGSCQNKCDYCAQNPSDGACQPDLANVEINYNPSFGCACSFSTCNKYYPDGNCVLFSGFCPAASYCCTNPCRTNEIRNDVDGKCYPKCSTSCREESRACICGESPTGQIAQVDQFCAKDLRVYTDETTCDEANIAFNEAQRQEQQ